MASLKMLYLSLSFTEILWSLCIAKHKIILGDKIHSVNCYLIISSFKPVIVAVLVRIQHECCKFSMGIYSFVTSILCRAIPENRLR